jgi:hypothetical protein
LIPSLFKASKKFPDLITSIDVAAGSTDEPYRQVLSTIRPGVPATINPIKHHFGICSTLRVFNFCDACAIYGNVGNLVESAIVPGFIDALGVNYKKAIAAGQLVEPSIRQPEHPAIGAATAVQHEKQRPIARMPGF